jgi:hypothetical protein
VRYFEDPRLQARIAPPPLERALVHPAEQMWQGVMPPPRVETEAAAPEAHVEAPGSDDGSADRHAGSERAGQFRGADDGIPL